MSIPASSPADFAALVERDRHALLRLLDELEDDEWGAPTSCPGWSVLDLAVHLLGDDLGVLARDRDDYRGTSVPAGVDSEEAFVSFIDGLNDRWVWAGRRLSPRLATELLGWTGERLVALYRGQDPSAVTARVSWASDRPVPKWLDQARELTERWVHHQQIRHALGHPSWLEAEITGAVLDTFSWAFPYRLSVAPRPVGVSVEVQITGAVTRRWRFVASGEGWARTEDFDAREQRVELAMDSDTAWRLLTNGLPAEAQPVPSKNDDEELARILLRTRAIIGLPEP